MTMHKCLRRLLLIDVHRVVFSHLATVGVLLLLGVAGCATGNQVDREELGERTYLAIYYLSTGDSFMRFLQRGNPTLEEYIERHVGFPEGAKLLHGVDSPQVRMVNTEANHELLKRLLQEEGWLDSVVVP